MLSQQHRCQKLPKSLDVRWSYSVQHQCRFWDTVYVPTAVLSSYFCRIWNMGCKPTIWRSPPLPLPTSYSLPCKLEVDRLNTARGLQPKLNLVHFRLKIWHLVATNVKISRESNDQISCIISKFYGEFGRGALTVGRWCVVPKLGVLAGCYGMYNMYNYHWVLCISVRTGHVPPMKLYVSEYVRTPFVSETMASYKRRLIIDCRRQTHQRQLIVLLPVDMDSNRSQCVTPVTKRLERVCKRCCGKHC